MKIPSEIRKQYFEETGEMCANCKGATNKYADWLELQIITDAATRQIKFSEEEVERLDYLLNNLVRVGYYSEKSTAHQKMKETVKKLKSISKPKQ